MTEIIYQDNESMEKSDGQICFNKKKITFLFSGLILFFLLASTIFIKQSKEQEVTQVDSNSTQASNELTQEINEKDLEGNTTSYINTEYGFIFAYDKFFEIFEDLNSLRKDSLKEFNVAIPESDGFAFRVVIYKSNLSPGDWWKNIGIDNYDSSDEITFENVSFKETAEENSMFAKVSIFGEENGQVFNMNIMSNNDYIYVLENHPIGMNDWSYGEQILSSFMLLDSIPFSRTIIELGKVTSPPEEYSFYYPAQFYLGSNEGNWFNFYSSEESFQDTQNCISEYGLTPEHYCGYGADQVQVGVSREKMSNKENLSNLFIEEYQDLTNRTWDVYQKLPWGPGHIGGYVYALDVSKVLSSSDSV